MNAAISIAAMTAALAIVVPVVAAADDESSPLIGMEGRYKVSLRGIRIEAAPLRGNSEKEQPSLEVTEVLAETDPADAAVTQYTIGFVGWEARAYDLRQFVRLGEDSGANAALPQMLVWIRDVLPEGKIRELKLPTSEAWQEKAVNWSKLSKIGFGWIAAGLLLAWLAFRPRSTHVELLPPDEEADEEAFRRDLLSRLAKVNLLSTAQKVELERVVRGLLFHHFGFANAPPAETERLLREHPVAGPFLEALDEWLHKPGAHGNGLPKRIQDFLHDPSAAVHTLS